MLKKLVTSLEVSKRLKELGVMQKSAHDWVLNLDKEWVINPTNSPLHEIFKKSHPDGYASAFTCTELAAALQFPGQINAMCESDPQIEAGELIGAIENGFVAIDRINANIAKFWEGQ
jgi:hypothetical protein